MKLSPLLYEDDKQRLLELAIFMSSNSHQLNEGVGDGILRVAKKAGLKIQNGRGLLQIMATAGIHVSKVVYFAIKAHAGDDEAKEELKELLNKKVTKEDLIDVFLKLDTLTLGVLSGPINIIDALAGWNIMANIRKQAKTVSKRVNDAIADLDDSLDDLPEKIRKKVANNLAKIKRMVGA